jgi:hypothetical protein
MRAAVADKYKGPGSLQSFKVKHFQGLVEPNLLAGRVYSTL